MKTKNKKFIALCLFLKGPQHKLSGTFNPQGDVAFSEPQVSWESLATNDLYLHPLVYYK